MGMGMGVGGFLVEVRLRGSAGTEGRVFGAGREGVAFLALGLWY